MHLKCMFFETVFIIFVRQIHIVDLTIYEVSKFQRRVKAMWVIHFERSYIYTAYISMISKRFFILINNQHKHFSDVHNTIDFLNKTI